jgi:hypothetical protein
VDNEPRSPPARIRISVGICPDLQSTREFRYRNYTSAFPAISESYWCYPQPMANLRYFGSKLPYNLMCCELHKSTPSMIPIYDHRLVGLVGIAASYCTPQWLWMSGTSFITSRRLHWMRRALHIRRNISRRLQIAHIPTTTEKFGNQQSIIDRSHPDFPLVSARRNRTENVVTFELRTGKTLSTGSP